MEHAVVDDKVRADAELGVHARRERGTAWRGRVSGKPRASSCAERPSTVSSHRNSGQKRTESRVETCEMHSIPSSQLTTRKFGGSAA